MEKLRNAVVAIQTSQRIDASLEELYQAIEALCSHRMGEEVYAHLKALIESKNQSDICYCFDQINFSHICF